MKPESRQYRPEIDGLRAIAVLSVLMFHLDVSYFSGGFVGVDIFFVISGFLITGLITTEIADKGEFSFRQFYIRRGRRLFPALLVTVVTVFLLSALLFSPDRFERTSGAVIASIFSLSNFYFWNEAGYFDVEAATKPLLHTWSLSVEEQFYLFWPAFIVLLLRGSSWWLRVGVLVAGLASFVLGQQVNTGSLQQVFSDSQASAFFLFPFRIFEFAIGALLVWLVGRQPKQTWVSSVLFLLGLGLVLYPVFTYSELTPFPSRYSLVPCLGAALIIFSACNTGIGRVLNNPAMLWIGLCSYSVYLVHWPLIVFWRYYTFTELDTVDKVMLIVVSVLLGYFLYRYIEMPFRLKRSGATANGRLALAGIASVVIVVSTALHAWQNSGWPWRLPQELYQSWGAAEQKRSDYWGSWQVGVESPEEFSQDKLSVAVIGDSFAYDVANMLRDSEDVEVFYSGSTGHLCTGFTLGKNGSSAEQKKRCADNVQKFTADYFDADVIILADRESSYYPMAERRVAREYRAHFDRLRKGGFHGLIMIYGGRPLYSVAVYELVRRHGRLAGAGKFASGYMEFTVAQMEEMIAASTEFYASNNVYFYSPVPELCRDDWCDVLSPNGDIIYFDRWHFNYAGIKKLSPSLIKFLQKLPVETVRPDR
ncbi:MAG: acyltransferase family protein [Halioglobus sp.]